jgi:hypothetical protein
MTDALMGRLCTVNKYKNIQFNGDPRVAEKREIIASWRGFLYDLIYETILFYV